MAQVSAHLLSGGWLPVGLVNADKGAVVGGKQVNLGSRITESIKKSTETGGRIDWKAMDEKEVKEELGEGKLYGALVVPADFTASTVALTGTSTTGTPARPALAVLTNQSAGSLGSSLARSATTQAAESVSLQVGRELTARTGQAKPPAAARVLLADPAAVTVEDGHPLSSHSGVGLTAFYYALVLVVCGMLCANVISGQVGHALGYTHNDTGPLRRHRPLIRPETDRSTVEETDRFPAVEVVVAAIEGATILVAGGGRGIGKMLVEELHGRGAD